MGKSKNNTTNTKNKKQENNLDNKKEDLDLDWIEQMQNELNNSKNNKNNNVKNNKNNKKKNNFNDKNKIVDSNAKLSNCLNTYKQSDSESESESESESDSNKKIKTKSNTKISNNRFGFVESESESESDSESEPKSNSESEPKPKSGNNKFGSIQSDSDNDPESDENIDEDSTVNLEKVKIELKEKEDVKIDLKIDVNTEIKSNTTNLVANSISKVNLEQLESSENNKQKNVKLNKKQRMEQQQSKLQQKKSQYEFDLNDNSKNTQTKSSSQSNSLVTLYSEDTEVIIGGKTLISTSNITINSGLKYFVLGQNGIGKTTLLKQIYSKLIDKIDILMLDQDIQIESGSETIQEFILNADPVLYKSKKRMDKLEELEEMNDLEAEEYEKLSEIVYQREWDKYEAESKRIVNGLGFTNPNLPVSILSGGKRMILAIGKALLRKPEILMLDEPTNHLDLDVVIWLTDYLSEYKKTLIIITHQIGLVNSLSNVIWYVGNPELIGNKVYTIRGRYDKLLKFLEDKEKEVGKNYEKFNKKVEEMRKKSTPKKDVDEFIKKEGIPRPPKPYVVNITFDDVVELSTRNIIEFKEVDFGYPNSAPIYSKLNISLGMGSRMVLVGPNGCGKTTFFKLASAQLKPSEGYVIADERLRVGYYNQQIIDHLPLELNSIEYLQFLNPKLDINQCRTILGKLGIKKIDNLDLPTNKIGNLSGGQKARVSFASVQMANPHLILLDEPTNHLDLESIEGLVKGINEFNGGIVIITHDMYLIESIRNADIYQVKSSNIIKFQGDFEEYCVHVTEHNK